MAQSTQNNAKTRPNVLFLIMDDQRFDTIHALGNRDIKTPNLDSLCRRGVAFTNSYIMGGTSGAICMPSRVVYHTGRTLFHIEGAGQRIPPEHTTIGEHLGRHGYATFGTGKWHSDCDSFARSFASGANIFFGGMDDHWNMPVCDYPNDGVFPESKPHSWDGGTGEKTIHEKRFDRVAKGVHATELFARSAIDFIESYTDEAPFFAYAAFTAPHDPRTMPNEFLTMYDPDSLTIADNVMPYHPFDNGDLDVRDENIVPHPYTPARVRRETADYYAMISHYDHWLGKIIDALKVAGQLENTIIVHTADHGLGLGRHGLMGKQNSYDHSIHVPLIISGPGLPEGETRDTLVSSPDLFPTLCDLIGIETAPTVEGESYAAATCDPAVRHRGHVLTAYLGLQRSVRDERYKLIEYVVDGVRTTQLFDLHADPDELVNLADDEKLAPVRDELSKKLREWRDVYGDTADEFWTILGK
ncbi:MAG: DUF4976 domain-containing protein [Spirochaetaceae bacterium]|nr:MAG: DUF4976 domain-containing protein [Spirochaetaceae bacterium]